MCLYKEWCQKLSKLMDLSNFRTGALNLKKEERKNPTITYARPIFPLYSLYNNIYKLVIMCQKIITFNSFSSLYNMFDWRTAQKALI